MVTLAIKDQEVNSPPEHVPYSLPAIFYDSNLGNIVASSLGKNVEYLRVLYMRDPSWFYLKPDIADFNSQLLSALSDEETGMLKSNPKDYKGALTVIRAQKGQENIVKQIMYFLAYKGLITIPPIPFNQEWNELDKLFTSDKPSLIKAVQEFRYLFPEHTYSHETRYWSARGMCGPTTDDFINLLLKRGVITNEMFEHKECEEVTVNWGEETHTFFRISNIGIDWTRIQIDGNTDYPYVFKIGSPKDDIYDRQPGEKLNTYSQA